MNVALLPDDLLLEIALHLLKPGQARTTTFLSCCRGLRNLGQQLMHLQQTERSVAGGHHRSGSYFSCPMPRRDPDPTPPSMDPLLRHMARGVALAMSNILHVVSQMPALHDPHVTILNERR